MRLSGFANAHRFTAARHTWLARAAASAAPTPAAAPSAPAPAATLTALAPLTHARAAVAIRS